MSEKRRYETITVKKEDGIAWITLNRPHRLNAITWEMATEFSSALDDVEADKEVRCVVVTGAGDKAFSAGGDLSFFSEITTISAPEISTKGHELTRRIEASAKPFIAMINGFCIGGGLELALACDFRIAAEHADFGMLEIQRGLMPGWGGTQRLARIVGLSKAKELIMLGDRIPAQEALRIGLVNKVVPMDKLEGEVKTLAKRLVDGPPIALKYAKYAMNFGTQVPLEAGLRIESAAFGILFSTKDFVEGIQAFFEKRKPEFKGE